MNHSPPDNPENDAKLSHLYQKARVEEPPMHLDSAILSAARNSVDTPRKRHIWCTLRWAIPVTTFALALLTVSLVVHQKQEAPGLLMQGSKSEMEKAPKAISPMRKKSKIDLYGRAAPKITGKASTNIPPSKQINKKARPAVLEEGFSAPRESKAISSPPSRPTASRPKKMNRALRGLAEKTMQATDITRDPVLWMKKILTLRKQGHHAEAKASLKKFRVQYPDYPIPPELK
ncbi:MAG: hypothetical protein Q9M24_03785 [Mariprofundaceae bacterium]|nr:hypothetical protein [Mariprofundaceae bacterium]